MSTLKVKISGDCLAVCAYSELKVKGSEMDATLRAMAKKNTKVVNVEALERLRGRIKRSLKTRVARAREDLQISQSEVLAELDRHGLGRTQGSLSQIERGLRLPSVETLYVLAEYLGTSADYFIGLSESALSPADIEEELANAKGEGRIARLLAALNREQRAQVISFAEYLLMQSGQADAIAGDDQEALIASLNVLQRKYGPDADALLENIADIVPALRKVIGPPPKDKGVNSG
jgi:transcriptional regulator with XRE-family HTH domain